MKIRTLIILLCLLAGSLALLDSCKNDALPYMTETITTLRVVTQNLSTHVLDTFEYDNFNFSATNPSPPSRADTIRLQANSSYAIHVILLNETPNPIQDITDTIAARAANHLMVYDVDPSPGLIAVRILDKDYKGLPLGLSCTWATADSSGGWLRMILRQQPANKNGTETPGTTDFEADFLVMVR